MLFCQLKSQGPKKQWQRRSKYIATNSPEGDSHLHYPHPERSVSPQSKQFPEIIGIEIGAKKAIPDGEMVVSAPSSSQ
jgi:hypothetical protein